MKNFRMNFCHPIKGVLRIFKKNAKCAAHVIVIDTKESELVNVSLADIPKGDWNLALEWEYDGQQYNYIRKISID